MNGSFHPFASLIDDGKEAFLGAAALADAFQKYPGNFQKAFEEYDRSLRPTIEKIQTAAIEIGLKMFGPRSEEAIRIRNAQFTAKDRP